MAAPPFIKKYWPILGGFGLLGIGLGIGLTVTGLFAPFGLTVLGLIGAGALLFLASLVAALLVIAAIKIFKHFIHSSQISFIEDKPGNSITTTPSSNLSSSKTTTPSSPIQNTPQPILSEQQLKQNAEQVKKNIIKLFTKSGALYSVGHEAGRYARCGEPLCDIIEKDLTVAEMPNTNNYKIVFNYWMGGHKQYLGPFFSSEVAKQNSLEADDNKFKIDLDPAEHRPPPMLSQFKAAMDKRWGEDTLIIVCTKDRYVSGREEPYYYSYKAEISPGKIQHILQHPNGARPKSTSSLQQQQLTSQ